MKRRVRIMLAYFHEAFDNLRRGRWMTVSSVATMTFALVIIGLFFLLSVNIEQMLTGIRSKSMVIAYLEERTRPGDQERLLTEIRQLPGVKNVVFVTKEENLKRFSASLEENREILNALVGNPLPASIEVSVSEEEGFDIAGLAGRIDMLNGVESVDYGRAMLETLQQVATGIRLVILALGLVLGVAALFIITNTVKITVLARQDEIEVMRLVGATDWYIRWPYFLEGLIEGLLASGLAIGLLFAAYRLLLWKFALLPFLPVSLTFFSVALCARIVLAGALIGGGGSLVALRHVLKEPEA